MAAKLKLDDHLAEYNYDTDLWESENAELAAHLQLILENDVRSPNACMHYFVTRFDAEVLEWADESLPADVSQELPAAS